ncbi:MAG: NUDIX domain-containing protein [Oscillospiraceae bacterium]|nr:NUDIX domain-containing protein [Oscillospiraceae bacterium]
MKHLATITDKDILGSDALSNAPPRIAVNAVLFDADGRVALSFVRNLDLHTLPGGGVERGEDLVTAVKREIWEETGCDCEITGEIGSIFESRAEHNFTQERYYYAARVVGEKGELHLTAKEIEDATEVVWLSIRDAYTRIDRKRHDSYQFRYIRMRDMIALKEAMDTLNPKNFS